jgi:hypothetical protein
MAAPRSGNDLYKKFQQIIEDVTDITTHFTLQMLQTTKGQKKDTLKAVLYAQRDQLLDILRSPNSIKTDINAVNEAINKIQAAFAVFLQGVEKSNKRRWKKADKISNKLSDEYKTEYHKKLDGIKNDLKNLEADIKHYLETLNKQEEQRFPQEREEKKRAEAKKLAQDHAQQKTTKQYELLEDLFSIIMLAATSSDYHLTISNNAVEREFLNLLKNDAKIKLTEKQEGEYIKLQLDKEDMDAFLLNEDRYDDLLFLRRHIEQLHSKAKEKTDSGKTFTEFCARNKINVEDKGNRISLELSPSTISFAHYLIMQAKNVVLGMKYNAPKGRAVQLTLYINKNTWDNVVKNDESWPMYIACENNSEFLLKSAEIKSAYEKQQNSNDKSTIPQIKGRLAPLNIQTTSPTRHAHTYSAKLYQPPKVQSACDEKKQSVTPRRKKI